MWPEVEQSKLYQKKRDRRGKLLVGMDLRFDGSRFRSIHEMYEEYMKTNTGNLPMVEKGKDPKDQERIIKKIVEKNNKNSLENFSIQVSQILRRVADEPLTHYSIQIRRFFRLPDKVKTDIGEDFGLSLMYLRTLKQLNIFFETVCLSPKAFEDIAKGFQANDSLASLTLFFISCGIDSKTHGEGLN